ncbi:MAG TPA: excinuclease ABC subunit A, partial [Polyangiales bacterium]
LPIGGLTCITGVSGSGKSSLVLDTLVPAVAQALGDASMPVLPFASLEGVATIKSLVYVDQSPLGRTSRGNPATYLGAWDAFRKHFARTALAVERGYTPGRFSFNVAGGRCEACKGEGAETVEMQFLSDVTFSCPQCAGKRFIGPVLDVQLEGKSVADVLALTVQQARQAFARFTDITTRLDPLIDVGAGYLRLGQSLNTLSGGEAQRLKLAAALADATRDALIVLDEPTAGLHAQDVAPLLRTLHALVERGNTVVVVEHDMRVAAACDHVVDLGPGAGALGGRVLAAGTPTEVAASKSSATAAFLRAALRGLPAPTTGAAQAAVDPSMEVNADVIAVRGAREHNLKNVDVDIPRERLVVVTGPSGSGKSTLAFDVVFAESQRRYLETLSPYVRQYLKQLPRAAVDRVVGSPPGVSLEQRSTGGAKNSTVATVTEVAHYLRLLFARAGVLRCPRCAVPIAPRPASELAQLAAERFGRAEVSVLAPVVRSRKGAHREILARALRDGYTHARIDGKLQEIGARMSLPRFHEHDVELLVGSARANHDALPELMIRALGLGDGAVLLLSGKEKLPLSTRRACPVCATGYPELDPRFFSFNTQQGACARCEGHGYLEVEKRGRAEPERTICPVCDGKRLAGLALHTTVDGAHIAHYLALSVEQATQRLLQVKLQGRDALVGALPLKEAQARLSFLERVGLSYLTLDRPAWSLSGGELQRVRLAAQLGSGLTGLLYVLDEPTIGLHPRDTDRLLNALRELTDKGCSVLLVEHDAETIRAADHVIDVGPGGGHQGGRILAQGSPKQLAHDARSLTFASLGRPLAVPEHRRRIDRKSGVLLTAAREHNLKDVDLWIPAGRFTAITGVSGSGKSTLVRQVFLPAVRKALGLAGSAPGAHRSLTGAKVFRRAIEIDQTPIGRTPRSVPATYVGVWNEIRKLYAGTAEARARGFDASRFSFNVAKGRCSVCEGQGATSFEMSFLPEALVTCEACDGRRFDPETLSILLHGVSAGDLLELDVAEVATLLSAVPKVQRPLELLVRLGLGYLKLGQPSNTLSGGEAQRLKLVSELGASGSGPTLYVMDEPTTGLHREDVRRLLVVMQQLVERGDTVVVIEHHPDVIVAADWVVDLGPEGGAAGGGIVAQGTPEDIMQAKASHTGRVLLRELGRVKPAVRKPRAPQPVL